MFIKTIYRTKILMAVIALLTVPGLSQAATSKAESKTKEPAVLTLYGSPDRTWVAAVAKEYEAKTGIKVNWIRASSNEMYTRIEAEKDNPQGDVWFGGTADSHIAAADKGLIEPYCSAKTSELHALTRNFISNCRVTGLYAGLIGLGVNEGVLKSKNLPVPTSWKDLIKPEYKGMIAMPNPNTSGTAYTAMSTILQIFGEKEGWEYLRALHKNVAQYTESGAAPGQLTGRGEVGIAILPLHEVIRFAEEGYPIKPISPSEGASYEIGGISLIKGAPHPQQAKAFIDWALSAEVQKMAPLYGSFQLPSNVNTPVPDLALKHQITFDNIKVAKYDFVWSAKERNNILARWTKDVFSQPRN